VRLGLVASMRRAISPTRILPSLSMWTIEGVLSCPSAFGMTTGSSPSNTATTELVVPKSMPRIFSVYAMPSASARRSPAAPSSNQLSFWGGEFFPLSPRPRLSPRAENARLARPALSWILGIVASILRIETAPASVARMR
jgi:hypothetical protein